MVGQHPGHIQVLDDEPVVSLDQRVGDLVQEMPAQIRDAMVVTPQLRCGVATVTWPFLVARQRFRQSLLPLIPAANAFGASSIRATSAPSAVVGDGGEQDLGPVLSEHARNRRVSSCTATGPIPGRVTERGRLLSPTRIAGGRPFVCLLRSRNDATARFSS
jgi:hypothetical protein